MVGLTWHDAGHDNWCSVAKTQDQFYLRVNHPAFIFFDDFEEAAEYNAKLLYSTFNDRPLYLSLSGGLDSELVARTFVRCRIPFTPIILKIDDINYAESWYAEYWCRQNNITPIRLNLTVDEYYTNILRKYTKELHNTHILGIAISLYIADYVSALGGYFVNGTGDINYNFEEKKFYCEMVDFPTDVYRPGQHPSSFFMYTPEVALSYIYQFDPSVEEQENKLSFYKPILIRPKLDYLQSLYTCSQKIIDVVKARNQAIPVSNPHWYGTKENVINALRPK
jgi:hypothetical protein